MRLQILLQFSSTLSIRHSDICLERLRPRLGCVRNTAVVVSLEALAKVVCRSRVEALRIDFALQDVDVSKSHELELACRGVARDVCVEKPEGPASLLLRRDSLRSPFVASEAWRRGELNPCPRRYPRKHLHVYPAKDSEEPSHAPAHCWLLSVHEIDSQTGAVAPPVRQPAVHVFAASRRHCENVTVN